MTPREAINKCYDVLVELGGVREISREDFVFCHRNFGYAKYPNHTEYRFGGKFGFGGKFRIDSLNGFYIDYYREDRTKRLDAVEKKINKKLKIIYQKYVDGHEDPEDDQLTDLSS